MQFKYRITVVAIIGFILAAITIFLRFQCPTTQLSQKETIEQYFAYYDSKNEKGMQSLLSARDELLTVPIPMEYCEYVELVSCSEISRYLIEDEYQKIIDMGFPQEHIQVYYVLANIKFTEETPIKTGFGVMGRSWRFYLVRESESSPWLIVDYD